MTNLQRTAVSGFVGLAATATAIWLLWPTDRCISTLMLPADKNRKSCTNLLGLPADEPVALTIAVLAGSAAAAVAWRLLRRRPR